MEVPQKMEGAYARNSSMSPAETKTSRISFWVEMLPGCSSGGGGGGSSGWGSSAGAQQEPYGSESPGIAVL